MWREPLRFPSRGRPGVPARLLKSLFLPLKVWPRADCRCEGLFLGARSRPSDPSSVSVPPCARTVSSRRVWPGQRELSSAVPCHGCSGCSCPRTPVGAGVRLAGPTHEPPGIRRGRLRRCAWLGACAGCWGFCRGGKPCFSSATSFLSCGCRLEIVPLFPLFSPFARVPSGFVLFSDA